MHTSGPPGPSQVSIRLPSEMHENAFGRSGSGADSERASAGVPAPDTPPAGADVRRVVVVPAVSGLAEPPGVPPSVVPGALVSVELPEGACPGSKGEVIPGTSPGAPGRTCAGGGETGGVGTGGGDTAGVGTGGGDTGGVGTGGGDTGGVGTGGGDTGGVGTGGGDTAGVWTGGGATGGTCTDTIGTPGAETGAITAGAAAAGRASPTIHPNPAKVARLTSDRNFEVPLYRNVGISFRPGVAAPDNRVSRSS